MTNQHGEAMNGGRVLPPTEAVALLDATLEHLRSSRCRLEAEAAPGQGEDDALVYLLTAEMHLKAARRRLGGPARSTQALR